MYNFNTLTIPLTYRNYSEKHTQKSSTVFAALQQYQKWLQISFFQTSNSEQPFGGRPKLKKRE